MGKSASDWFLDQYLNSIVNTIAELYVNAGEPLSWAACATGALVGPVAMTPASFAALSAGVSGRKTTVLQLDDQNIVLSGDGDHVSMREAAGGNNAFFVTTATSQTLSSGGQVTITPWDIEIEYPT